MNTGSPSLMAMQNSFWALSYPMKPYDLSIHPAFLHSSYRGMAGSSSAYTIPPALMQTQQKTKSETFTIDAILNRDRHREPTSDDDQSRDCYRGKISEKRHNDNSRRRQQRLYETGHPYPTVVNMEEKDRLHRQLHYKQFSDEDRTAEKSEKKSVSSADNWTKTGSTTDGWTKQTKGKRVRTIFTPEQLERMEAEFARQQYMVGTERYYLASSLNLTEAQVKVWFQNRRIKWRKQHLEQQQAKLKSLDIYKDGDSASDSESDDEVHRNPDESTHLLSNPFQSPKELRCTQ